MRVLWFVIKFFSWTCIQWHRQEFIWEGANKLGDAGAKIETSKREGNGEGVSPPQGSVVSSPSRVRGPKMGFGAF